ncbi:MAG: hypothetical protein RIB47_01790 [Cyclobacteriaceae bacterium]
MFRKTCKFLFLLQIVCTANAQQQESPLVTSFEEHKKKQATTSYNLPWIQLGPTINSARVEAVQVDTSKPGTLYAAFGSGNLWKTNNNGLTWKPIFEQQPSLGIGDIALAPSNPDIIYLGTGESLKKPRNFTMPGTGVYRSDDAGETWKNLGLSDSWHIGEIVVHPTNPDVVYVAVLGHFWSTNTNRGVYRSMDGGKTWEHVLYVDDQTGANDIVISPSNPSVLYASMWENNPSINGKKSNIYYSKDAGKTWSKSEKGLPTDEGKGRIGLTVSYTNPNKVYAFMDHREKEEGKGAAEIYRSMDGGVTWAKTHDHELMFLSVVGWYFVDIYVNPKNDEEIYALGVRLAHSTDGGKTFEYIGGEVNHLFPSVADPLHLDHCEMWINPENSNHLVLGNDGGLYQSFDRGKTWTHFNNIPAGEFYDITLDNKTPYNIYGGTQDNSTVYGRAREWNPEFYDGWKYLWIDPWSGGDGCITLVDPDDENTIYFSSQEGGIRRMDLTTGLSVPARPKLPEGHPPVKYNFISPYMLSPHDHKTLYLAGNYVMKSTDRGDQWEIISEDLSVSRDKSKKALAAGAMAESTLERDLLYVGMDRGALWVTMDGGKNWEERSKGLSNNYIRSITPSKYVKSRVYITLSGMNYDDLGTYIYKSEDYGKTWESIKGDLPNEVAYVIKEDPVFESILYAGLYRGAYLSTDRGKSWQKLGNNMPATSVADIEIDIKSKDLIAATHGRGMYKLNLSPIHEAISREVKENYLFEIPQIQSPFYNGSMNGVDYRKAEKLPITFYSREAGPATINIRDSTNQVVWSTELKSTKGYNQFRWDLILKRVESDLPYFIHYNEFISAGKYQVELNTNGSTLKKDLTVLEAQPYIED